MNYAKSSFLDDFELPEITHDNVKQKLLKEIDSEIAKIVKQKETEDKKATETEKVKAVADSFLQTRPSSCRYRNHRRQGRESASTFLL